MKVCVYAICKNESQFVDRFMDSMSEADYVCVLDTGSSDDTVKKLRARGAIVGETVVSPWRFDTARNESLGLIPADADICCAIDLDEQFHPGWRAALERAWQPDTTRARYRYTWSFRPDGSEGMVFWADKIHKNGCYRWASPVHETLAYTGEGAERFVDAAGVQLDHHPDETKSRGQYLPLLELAVREDPQNDRNCHYLGREYMFRGEWQKAIETLARHLTLPSAVWADERCASMRYIARCLRALEQDDSAERWLHRAVAEAPHLREPYMDYAQLLYTQERWYGMVDVLRAALAITERPRTYICEADAWGSLPYDLLSLAYAHLGDAESAAAACRENASRISDHLRTEFRRTGRICGVIPAADFLCPPCPVIHFLHIQEIVQIGVRDCVIGGTPRRSCEPRRRIIRDLRHDIDSAFGEFLRRQTACLPPDGTAVPGLDDTASSERFLQDIAELAEHPCGADGKKGAAVRDFAVDSGLCIEIRFAPPLFSGEDPCGVQRDFRVIPCSAQGFVRSVFFFQPFSESGLE